MTLRSSSEREAKLSAWPGFEVPDLTGVLDGIEAVATSERCLDARYLDTADLRLIRFGITLRHRTGESDGIGEEGEGAWTLKLPEASDSATLVRRELTRPGPSGSPPGELVALVRGHVRTADLEPVARIQTFRRRLELRLASAAEEADPRADHEADLTVVGEVDDDEVSVLERDRVAARFREVEVEVVDGAPPTLLDAVVDRLTGAGAGAPDATPKLVRVLGPRARAAPELTVEEVGTGDRAGRVLEQALTDAVRRVVLHHHVVLLDEDPEGVHQMRVGLRHLRSDLRTFRPLLAAGWADELRDEAGWLADELGPVRDADVLLARLEGHLPELATDDDRTEADALLDRLRQERADAQRGLAAHLTGNRYAELLDRLVAAATDPRWAGEARRPAARVLPSLVAGPWGKLARAVGGLGADPGDEELHRVRVRVKRARYAASVAVPVIGDPAREAVRRLSKLQDVLGDHHDAVVAEEWLRGALADAPPGRAVAGGQLIALERARAAAGRGDWRPAWSKASKKRVWKWLR